MSRTNEEYKACMKTVMAAQRGIALRRGTNFGIMVDKDYDAIQYQRRLRLSLRIYYRMKPNLMPASLCIVHMGDRKDCSCQ